eukprot:1064040-Pyramimonas_sp.AAC.1
MIRRPPRSTRISSAASDVYKRQVQQSGVVNRSRCDLTDPWGGSSQPVSYTHLRAHETGAYL